MINKIISTIVIIVLCFTNNPAFAKPEVTPVKKGDKAPFAGVLFNVDAAAKVKVDIEHAREQCKIEVEKEKDLEKAKKELELAKMKAAEEAAKKELALTLALKNDQINFLNQTIERQNEKLTKNKNRDGLYLGLGVLGGILLTVGAGFALGQASK